MSADAYLLLALIGSTLTLLSMQIWAFTIFGILFAALCLRLAWLALRLLSARSP